MTTEEFLRHFPNHVFQVYADQEEKGVRPKVVLEYSEKFFRDTNRICGSICFTPNGFKGGRKIENLVSINAVYADLDLAKDGDNACLHSLTDEKKKVVEGLKEYCCPTFVIETRNGVQPIWLVDESKTDEDTQLLAKGVINGIIQWSLKYSCKGDKVKDIARVLRIPGYYHMKGQPFMCKVKKYTDKKHSLKELKNFFFQEEKKVKALEKKLTIDFEKKGFTDPISLAIEALDFQSIIVAAFESVGRAASFDKQKRLILDGRLTGTHQGKIDGGRFLASNSHEPFIGNALTAVGGILTCSNKEARAWIVKAFNLEREMKKIQEDRAAEVERILTYKAPVHKKPKKFIPYTWGTKGLDRKIWPMKPDHYTVLAGESSGGKTAYAFFMAAKNAQMGHNVLFLTLEMNTEEIKERLARERACITIDEYRLEEYPLSKQEVYDETLRELNATPHLFLHGFPYDAKRDIETILAVVDAKAKRDGISMVIIDNLDKIERTHKKDSSFERAEHVSAQILKFTQDRRIPILLVHHYNQKAGKAKRGLESLRGSTKIGHDAYTVLDIDRDFEAKTPYDKARSVITAFKNRAKGERSTATMFFDKGEFKDQFLPPAEPTVDDRGNMYLNFNSK